MFSLLLWHMDLKLNMMHFQSTLLIFLAQGFFKATLKMKQAMVTLRGMAEHKFSNVYQCLTLVLHLYTWILVFPLIPFSSFLFPLFSGPSFPPSRASLFELCNVGGCCCRWVAQSRSNLDPSATMAGDFLLLYWDNFGKNQTPLQRNGMTAIPKIQNYPFPVYYVACLFTCPCVWWFDTYWMVLKFYGRFQLKHFEIACLSISIQFWVEILFALRAKEYFAKRIKQLDHHLGD